MHIFSGMYKNRPLQSPKGLKTRPTSGRLREALFNICQGYIEGCRFLDLFAGSGAMGLEAMSRGARIVTFIDDSKESIRCIQANVRTFNEEKRANIIYGDVFNTLNKIAKQGLQYDIIYADPPYDLISASEYGQLSYSMRLLKMIDEMVKKNEHLLAPGGVLFLEDAVSALTKNEPLENLILKSSRQMGRSALHYYILKNDQ